MSFNNFNSKSFNPNIWDAPRPNNPPPFINNQQNFFPNNNNNHFQNTRPNFFPQNTQVRPLLSFNQPPINDNGPFRKFNSDFHRNNNNNNQRGGRNNNFQQNRGWNKDNHNRNNDFNVRVSEPFDNSTNERKHECTEENRPKSLVEQLKSTMKKNNYQAESSSNDNIDTHAKNASKKLLNEIKRMNKGNVKDLINNPKQPHKKAALNIHAREKLREGMRKQLKTLGGAVDDQDVFFDADESANFESIPQTLIAQIGQELGVEDMDIGNLDEEVVVSEDMEVIEKNLGNDFLYGSEQLLMNGFSLLNENEGESEAPPLPTESNTPIKPPEPVPPPDEMTKKLWPLPPPKSTLPRQNSWDIESKNLDPPPTNPIPVITSSRCITSSVDQPPPSSTSINIDVIKEIKVKDEISEPVHMLTKTSSTKPLVDDWDESGGIKTLAIVSKTPQISTQIASQTPQISTPISSQTPQISTPSASQTPQISTPSASQIQQTSIPGAKEHEQHQQKIEQVTQQPPPQKSNQTYGDYKRRNDKPDDERNFNRPRQNQQHQKSSRGPTTTDWDDSETPRTNDSWISNNRRNINNNNNNNNNNNHNDNSNNERTSRFEKTRNNFNNRNDMNDGFNYRFSANDGDKNRLKTIMGPKAQFKGSFNKNARSNNRDSSFGSREKTPTNTEDFDTLPVKDARPCYHTLKKIMEIDAEMTLVHDKIHGIDKVIQNLQSERISHQKKFSQLQHDRKILFDNLIKRSQFQNVTTTEFDNSHRDKSREKEKSPTISHKSHINKKLEKMVDQKKRKSEETVVEDPVKKKKFVPIEEPKSVAQRAKEKEEKELKERLEKIRKQKQQRREKEEAERRKLEEEAIKASNDKIIKLEKVEKVQKSQTAKPSQNKPTKSTFNTSELLQIPNFKLKNPHLTLKKITLSQSSIDQFNDGRCPSIDRDAFEKESVKQEVSEQEVQLINDPEKDPLSFDPMMTNPPTPGGNLATTFDENSKDLQQNYEEWNGNFESHTTPIVFLQNIDDRFMICAAEDGKLYKYELSSGHVEAVFESHTQICNSFIYDQKDNLLYTASSDGSVFKIKFKSFQSMGSKSFNESLQVIEKSKSIVYIGAKSGNIFKVKSDLSNVEEADGEESNNLMCCVEGLILCLKYSKEGSRSIILVASRGKAIQVRDAHDGLLLRTLAEEMSNVSVYDMALDGNTIYCGCNLHEIFAIDFTNGALIKKRKMMGAGAICVKIYKEFLIAACYDGNIYIFNINSDDESAVNITGPSNMLLAMDLWDGRIIASTKDKTVKIINIPT